MGLVTLHVDGCAAILCHVKYLKVGRSSLSCFFFFFSHILLQHTFGSEKLASWDSVCEAA
jgi:hypothetical protein